MSRLRAIASTLGLTMLLVAPAEATTSYYQGSSGEVAFNSAVAGLTLLNPGLTFSSSDLINGVLVNASGTGINFLGFEDPFSFNTPADLSVNLGKLTAAQSGKDVEITFPGTGIYAFGFHITVSTGSANWCIDLTQTGCAYTIVNSSPSDVQFFGFVSNAPVSAPLYIHYQGGSPTIVFPNFEAFTAAEAPEPGAMLLAGLGLIILPLLRRKLRQGS